MVSILLNTVVVICIVVIVFCLGLTVYDEISWRLGR